MSERASPIHVLQRSHVTMSSPVWSKNISALSTPRLTSVPTISQYDVVMRKWRSSSLCDRYRALISAQLAGLNSVRNQARARRSSGSRRISYKRSSSSASAWVGLLMFAPWAWEVERRRHSSKRLAAEEGASSCVPNAWTLQFRRARTNAGLADRCAQEPPRPPHPSLAGTHRLLLLGRSALRRDPL